MAVGIRRHAAVERQPAQIARHDATHQESPGIRCGTRDDQAARTAGRASPKPPTRSGDTESGMADVARRVAGRLATSPGDRAACGQAGEGAGQGPVRVGHGAIRGAPVPRRVRAAQAAGWPAAEKEGHDGGFDLGYLLFSYKTIICKTYCTSFLGPGPARGAHQRVGSHPGRRSRQGAAGASFGGRRHSQRPLGVFLSCEARPPGKPHRREAT
jgi:hypothetical protein